MQMIILRMVRFKQWEARLKMKKIGKLKFWNFMSFQVFHCLVQSEVKQIILVKSSLSEVRFKLHEVALREVMSQCNYSPLNYRPQRSCGKVVFLHLSVILFTGSCPADAPKQTPLGRHPAWADNSPRQTLPRQTPPRDSHYRGRYASYWNAFMYFQYLCWPVVLLCGTQTYEESIMKYHVKTYCICSSDLMNGKNTAK